MLSIFRLDKTIVFLGCLIPLVYMICLGLFDQLGAEPIKELQRESGSWGMRMLFLALSVTPIRYVFNYPKVMKYRRMIGLFAFFYAFLHVAFWAIVDQGLDLPSIITDLIKRQYIWFGAIAFLILLTLALTSFKFMPKKLGIKNWKLIHKGVYISGVLVLVHYYMSLKGFHIEPIIYGSILLILLLIRVAANYTSIFKREPIKL